MLCVDCALSIIGQIKADENLRDQPMEVTRMAVMNSAAAVFVYQQDSLCLHHFIKRAGGGSDAQH